MRDFIVLTAGTSTVFGILAASGALGWIEALTAVMIVGVAATAFYVGTTPSPEAGYDFEDDDQAVERSLDMRGLVEALPQPALYVGVDGRVSAANSESRRLFKINEGRAALASAVIRRPELLSAIEAASQGDDPQAVEVALPANTDQIWIVRARALPTPFWGVLVVLEDRSAIRRAERARADFLANASHELRTPLTSLAGFIETMRGPAKDDRDTWDRFLDIMYSQTERMKRLIQDLLSLSRIELSAHQTPSDLVDLEEIVLDALNAMRPVADERGVSLEFKEKAVDLAVTGARDELVQVAHNLIDNALKYSAPGSSVAIEAGVAESPAAARAESARRWTDAGRINIQSNPGAFGRAAWLRIEDRGPGIESRHLPRLGERFYRADESRGGAVPGTGLGLAIVKHIMARHQGGLSVESRIGHGTAFGAWLPSAKSERTAFEVSHNR